MRTWLLIVAVVLLPTLGSSASYSILNPAIRNPVGAGTVPVSSIRSGLLTTPAPIDTAADLSITGNVRDGKYFRGNVPYRSTTDFGLDPGSSSLNSSRTAPSLSSFLRDTAGPEDFGRLSSRYGTRPYYSPAEMVAATMPGRPGVFRPEDTRILNGSQRSRSATTHLFALESSPNQQIPPGRGVTTTDADLQGLQTLYGPLTESLSTSDGTSVGDMSPDLPDVGLLTPGEAAIRRQDEKLAAERLRERTRQSLLEARRETRIGDDRFKMETRTPAQVAADAKKEAAARYRLSPLETSTPFVDSALRQDAVEPKGAIGPELRTIPGTPALREQDSFTRSQAEGVTAEPGPVLLPPSGVSSQETPGAEQDDVMERIRRQLDDLAKTVESRLQAEPGGTGQTGSVVPAEKTYEVRSRTQPYMSGSGGALRPYEPRGAGSDLGREMLAPANTGGALGKVDYSGQTGFESPERPGLEVSRKIISLPDGLSKLSRAELSGEAKRIRGSHKSLDSFSEDKFSRHVQAAEDYLGAGKYYKAANSFALASVYKPDDPQALAGRSHALFAAGEYISSALLLSRALAISPDRARAKIDMVTLLGGQSRLAGRIADVEQWFARSGSGRLQLLLGYVYFQTGRLNEATKAIEAAYTKIPQSPAIPAIKEAIDAAAAR